MKNIAIIGAGLSGLTVANLLKDKARVTVFEKSRGVGGRMATRRAEPWFFDHGAQYFTARTPSFREFIQPMVEAGIVQRWDATYAKIDRTNRVETIDWSQGEPRYVAVPGMNALCKYLAQGVDVHLNTRISAMENLEKWELKTESGERYSGFDWVLLTVPSPQAVELLPDNFTYKETVATTEMRGCFSLMLGFDKTIPLGFDAAHTDHPDISWLAVNSCKPGRQGGFSLMVHSSEEFAEARFDDNREQLIDYLCDKTSEIIGHDLQLATHRSLHGWRYANNANHHPQNPVLIDKSLQLAACGDWCEGGRVEGAFVSASRLLDSLTQSLSSNSISLRRIEGRVQGGL